MGKYHFHVRINGDLELDTNGVELSCEYAARSVIVECLREFFLKSDVHLPVNDCQFEVGNELGVLGALQGRTVFVIRSYAAGQNLGLTAARLSGSDRLITHDWN
jgi:hypothetical protein